MKIATPKKKTIYKYLSKIKRWLFVFVFVYQIIITYKLQFWIGKFTLACVLIDLHFQTMRNSSRAHAHRHLHAKFCKSAFVWFLFGFMRILKHTVNCTNNIGHHRFGLILSKCEWVCIYNIRWKLLQCNCCLGRIFLLMKFVDEKKSNTFSHRNSI